jgi:peptidoglycan/LPS O-acetylase OafA/YrhL
MAQTHSPDRHIPSLDGLRGLAVIAVILCHANHATGGPLMVGRLTGPVASVFGWGWIGVDLFFVLSGFLITGILFDAKGGDGYFRKFYARRILRIFPLYFGFLLLVIALSRLGCSFTPWVSRDGALSLGLFFYNFWLVFTHQFIDCLHAFWSLAVEEHFYLFWPLAVFAFHRRALMRLCLAGAVLSLLLRVALILGGTWPLSAFFLTPCHLDGLLAGSCVALAWRDPTDWARVQRWSGRVVLGSGCLLLGIALGQRHFLPDIDFRRGDAATVDSTLVLTLGLSCLAVLFAGLVAIAVGANQGDWPRRVFEQPALRTIGKYSYGIYVFHPLILSLTVALLSPASHLPVFVAKPVVAIWALVASLVTAWLSYHCFEKHFLRLKRYFDYRKESPTPPLFVPQPAMCSNA